MYVVKATEIFGLEPAMMKFMEKLVTTATISSLEAMAKTNSGVVLMTS